MGQSIVQTLHPSNDGDRQSPPHPAASAASLSQQIDLRAGLKLVMVDVTPNETIRIDFETTTVPLEFSYHLSGSGHYRVIHDQGEKRFGARPGLNMTAAFPNACGQMA
jgi:hypothetical protein